MPLLGHLKKNNYNHNNNIKNYGPAVAKYDYDCRLRLGAFFYKIKIIYYN
jgi:hypothetical protein